MGGLEWLALLSGGSNILGGLFPSGRQKQGNRLQRQQMDLLASFMTPGAFEENGFGSNYFFGQPSALQRKSRSGIEAFLNQPSPESRTLDFTRPILEGMLTGTGPQFERDISLANSQGGRFSSGNAIMRGEALRNLFNMRNQTAGTLGALSGQAGNADWSRLMGGAELANNDQNRRAQLLASLLGFGGQIAFGGPQSQNPLQALGQGGIDLATLLSLLGKKDNVDLGVGRGQRVGTTPGIGNA